jgi:hypothetical protein
MESAGGGGGDDDDDDQDHERRRQLLVRSQQDHLDWSDRQGRILTANGRAIAYWSAVPFEEADLPHYWLERGGTRQAFDEWNEARDRAPRIGGTGGEDHDAIIVGAWSRTVFFGEWDFSTRRDEHAYNLQSRTLFVDLRVPKSRRDVFGSAYGDRGSSSCIQSVRDMRRGEELRWHARQHVFAGFSRLTRAGPASAGAAGACRARGGGGPGAGMAASCARHHCLDWNYVGVRRPVPNQWWIQIRPGDPDVWREWAYPTNELGHHYYGEEWERLTPSAHWSGEKEGVVAFRKRASADEDGVLVVVGDRFSYCAGRPLVRSGGGGGDKSVTVDVPPYGAASLVELVDRAVEAGDLDVARAWLGRIRGGHGRVPGGWTIDCATEFWKEGTSLWPSSPEREEPVRLVGDSVDACAIVHGRDEWGVAECNLPTLEALESFLRLPKTAALEPAASLEHRGEKKRLRSL